MDFLDVMLWGQIAGTIAMVTDFCSTQIKQPRQILVSRTVAALFWLLHYACLKATAAIVMTVIIILRNSFAVVVADKYLVSFVFSIILAAFGATFFTINIQDVISWLPFMGTACLTCAIYWRDNGMVYRALWLMSSSLWFFYFWQESSVPGILTCMINASLVLVAFYRYDLPMLKAVRVKESVS